jgi:hypothetical protein
MKTSADRAAARSKSRPRASISYPQRWRRTRRKAKAMSRKLFALDAEGTCIKDVTLVTPTQIRTAGERELSNRVSSRHRAIGFEHSLSDEAHAPCCQPLKVGLASEARSTKGTLPKSGERRALLPIGHQRLGGCTGTGNDFSFGWCLSHTHQ